MLQGIEQVLSASIHAEKRRCKSLNVQDLVDHNRYRLRMAAILLLNCSKMSILRGADVGGGYVRGAGALGAVAREHRLGGRT